MTIRPLTLDTAAAYWDDHFEIDVQDEGLEDGDPDIKYRGGWTDGAVASFGYEECKEYKPTHWKPLPRPQRLTKSEFTVPGREC